jgi:hypothetical protein
MSAISDTIPYWLIFKKSSQKPLGRFDYDIVEMLIRWSYNSFELLVLIKRPRWPPQQFLTL